MQFALYSFFIAVSQFKSELCGGENSLGEETNKVPRDIITLQLRPLLTFNHLQFCSILLLVFYVYLMYVAVNYIMLFR